MNTNASECQPQQFMNTNRTLREDILYPRDEIAFGFGRR